MMASGMSSRFEYNGWHVSIEIGNAADPKSCYAELSYWQHRICRVDLSTALDACAVRWALDSRACDFIDHCWSTRLRSGAQAAARFDLDIR